MTNKTIFAEVERIFPLTESIVQLLLKPEDYVDYQAGQYLNVIQENEQLSYSIANAPLGSHKYELHIRHSRDNPSNQKLFAHIKKHGKVSINLPFGACSIDKIDPTRPIIFLAGGTGFAQVKAMIEQLLASDDPKPFELYWGARVQGDLYFDDKLKHWEDHVDRFKYTALISDEKKDILATKAIEQHPEDLHQWQVVLSGPFDMVYSARDALVDHGLPKNQLFSDAFSFEKD